MGEKNRKLLSIKNAIQRRVRILFPEVPLLGWLLGMLIAVVLERFVGELLAEALGLPRVPVLFGFVMMLKDPFMIPGIFMYILLIFIFPIGVVARLTSKITNGAAAKLLDFPIMVSVVIHIGLLYAVLYWWSEISDYRVLTLKLTLIAVIVTMSLNVVNGYMGEFSCSHPGFMALGAYAASVFTVVLFVNDKMFGHALLPAAFGPFMFPIALILGGIVAALGALAIAVPSFRTRGDYLAIISLAFMFIVKSMIENLEVVGGPRGLSSQPDLASLPTVFIWTVACIWITNNFVRSTLGKALNAVRDDEIAR